MAEERFFDSQIVTDAIQDIVEMQNQVLIFAQYGEFATIPEQRENLQLLRDLQQKQKNMCFRCTLVDDPDAKHLLAEVLAHFEEFGHTVDPEDPMAVFAEVEANLDIIEKELDFCEKFGYFPGEEPGGETPPTSEV